MGFGNGTVPVGKLIQANTNESGSLLLSKKYIRTKKEAGFGDNWIESINTAATPPPASLYVLSSLSCLLGEKKSSFTVGLSLLVSEVLGLISL